MTKALDDFRKEKVKEFFTPELEEKTVKEIAINGREEQVIRLVFQKLKEEIK